MSRVIEWVNTFSIAGEFITKSFTAESISASPLYSAFKIAFAAMSRIVPQIDDIAVAKDAFAVPSFAFVVAAH